jgi:hypothetical protein
MQKTPVPQKTPMPSPRPRPRRRSRAAFAVLAGLAGAAAIFAVGRWTAEDASPPDTRRASPTPAARVASRAAWAAPPPAAAPAAAIAAAESPAAAAERRPQTKAEVVTRAAADTRYELEKLRADMLSRCWPAAGLTNGQETVRLTFHVAFDAQGREIARGISEDRRAPAGPLARCLRALPAGTLKIPPPGTRLGVKVPIVFP